ncbi:MAG: hypothetical protein WEB58_10660 [Planctomycetaceae bacterium]
MHRLMSLGLIATMSTFSGCGSAANKANATADKAESYKHHRILVWSVDKTSHDVKGFDEGIIGPSQEMTLKPVADYTVSIRTGPIEEVTVTDFKTEWREKRIPFRFSTGSGSAEGTKDIENLFLHFEYGSSKKAIMLDSIVIGIPEGSSATKKYLTALDPMIPSDALEDLLLIAAADPERPLDLGDFLEIYRIVRKSRRIDGWRDSLKNGTPTQQLFAAGILMKFGDPDGRHHFCNACLTAKGNSQVHLVDYLLNMPASDETLATIVKLIVAPTVYRTKELEGVGLAQFERRVKLTEKLKRDYSREALKPYAAELRQWAKSEMGQKYGGDELLKLLDDK